MDSSASKTSPATGNARAYRHNGRFPASSRAVSTVQGPIRVYLIDFGASAPQFSNAKAIGGIVRTVVFLSRHS